MVFSVVRRVFTKLDWMEMGMNIPEVCSNMAPAHPGSIHLQTPEPLLPSWPAAEATPGASAVAMPLGGASPRGLTDDGTSCCRITGVSRTRPPWLRPSLTAAGARTLLLFLTSGQHGRAESVLSRLLPGQCERCRTLPFQQRDAGSVSRALCVCAAHSLAQEMPHSCPGLAKNAARAARACAHAPLNAIHIFLISFTSSFTGLLMLSIRLNPDFLTLAATTRGSSAMRRATPTTPHIS